MAERRFLILNRLHAPVAYTLSFGSKTVLAVLPPDTPDANLILDDEADRIDLKPGYGPDPLTPYSLAVCLAVDSRRSPRPVACGIGTSRATGEIVVVLNIHPLALN